MPQSFQLAAGVWGDAGMVVADAVLKGTVLLAAVCVLTALSTRTSAAVRHRVWALTMAALLVLPGLSRVLPSWRIPILPSPVVEELSNAQRPPDDGYGVSATNGVEGLSDESGMEPDSAFPSGVALLDGESPHAGVMRQAGSDWPNATAAGVSPWQSRWIPCLIGAWSVGGTLLLGAMVAGSLRIRRLRRNSRSLTEAGWTDLVRELSKRLRLRRPVRLLVSRESVVPIMWGLVRPAILLPRESRRWPDELRRCVLLHELAHVKRCDVAVQLLGRVACAVYWFHPLAWWGLRQLRQEREQACDDWVVHTGQRASDYTGQLLAIARSCCRPRGLAVAVEMARKNGLERRVRALFDETRSHSPLGRLTGAALLMGIAAAAIGLAMVRPVSSRALPTESTSEAPQAATATPLVAPFTQQEAMVSRNAWSKKLGTPVELTNSVGIKLNLIPPGEFTMGSPEDEVDRDEKERSHRVRITAPFYLGVYEVTQAEYNRVIGTNPSYFRSQGGGKELVSGMETDRFPVENVTWETVDEFCRKLSALPEEEAAGRAYRLPTEAEWEYACRAGTTTAYGFGEAFDAGRANSAGHEDWIKRSCEVGSYAPNAFGLYDMHGNVMEWCRDWSGDYQDSPVDDPQGPSLGKLRVLRGGSWSILNTWCRSAQRGFWVPALRNFDVGFRVVMIPAGVASVIPLETEDLKSDFGQPTGRTD